MKKSIEKKVNMKSKDVIKDNNFLFEAFQVRLLTRLVHIFDKYKIPINQSIIKKNLEENFINNLKDQNEFIIEGYIKLILNYEKIIWKYVEEKNDINIIKKSTMDFIKKVKEKNNTIVTKDSTNNFKDYIYSIIMVYDNYQLNNDIITRIDSDTFEIIQEFNRNNYNFVIECINDVIKNIIDNM